VEVALTIIIGLLMLTLFVVVHEWGHYMVAKKSGITVLEFSIGFGPAIAKWHSKGTQISLRCLPLGGYVKFFGDDEGDEKKPGSFTSAPVFKRFLTVLAGPAMNVLLAFILAVSFLCIYGDAKVMVGSVEPGSPAQEAGLQPGDELVRLNGVDIDFMLDLEEALTNTQGDSSQVTVLRDRETYSYDIPYKTDGSKKIGISQIAYERKTYSFFEAVALSFKWMYLLVKEMLAILGALIFTGQGVENLAGPVGTISIIGSVAKTGFENILRLASLISINLAVINLLPLPALDGGKIVLLGVEAVRKKPVSIRLESILNTIGFVLIFGFAIYLTFQDITRMAGG
jgi:regulator of sigma E protease